MTDRDHAAESMAQTLAAEGWGVIPPYQFRMDMESQFREIWSRVAPYTMTSMERGYALYKAVEYVCQRGLPGDIVECGVWKGGSCMLVALALLSFGHANRRLYLYDTYTGMPRPTDEDVIAWNDSPVAERWEQGKFDSWAVGLDDVKENLASTRYPAELLTFVEGDVAKTLQTTRPQAVSLLRLDTDWYESTVVELDVLYPLLVRAGVMIIDDYGHFKGARKAVDRYFSKAADPPLFVRVDYTGRVGVKV